MQRFISVIWVSLGKAQQVTCFPNMSQSSSMPNFKPWMNVFLNQTSNTVILFRHLDLEPASNGQSRNCRFWHFCLCLIFQVAIKRFTNYLLGTRIELFVNSNIKPKPHRSNCIYLQYELLKFKMSIRIKIYCEIKCAMVAGTCWDFPGHPSLGFTVNGNSQKEFTNWADRKETVTQIRTSYNHGMKKSIT